MIAKDREKIQDARPSVSPIHLSVSTRCERSIVTYFSAGEDRDLRRQLHIICMLLGLRVPKTACELVLITY